MGDPQTTSSTLFYVLCQLQMFHQFRIHETIESLEGRDGYKLSENVIADIYIRYMTTSVLTSRTLILSIIVGRGEGCIRTWRNLYHTQSRMGGTRYRGVNFIILHEKRSWVFHHLVLCTYISKYSIIFSSHNRRVDYQPLLK